MLLRCVATLRQQRIAGPLDSVHSRRPLWSDLYWEIKKTPRVNKSRE